MFRLWVLVCGFVALGVMSLTVVHRLIVLVLSVGLLFLFVMLWFSFIRLVCFRFVVGIALGVFADYLFYGACFGALYG